MRIDVDRVRCEGHGLCVAQAPALFSLDDDDELIYHADGTDVPEDLLAGARAAMAYCPVAALKEAP